MLNQEIFDKVAAHLLQQNAKSLLPHLPNKMRCALYGQEGRKCAIGCLIPTETYRPQFEYSDLEEVLEKIGLVDNIELCEKLQHLHDNFEPVFWKAGLIHIASTFILINSVLDLYPTI